MICLAMISTAATLTGITLFYDPKCGYGKVELSRMNDNLTEYINCATCNVKGLLTKTINTCILGSLSKGCFVKVVGQFIRQNY